MTGSADCRDIRHALGVYVLGAIDPAERAMVDAHLSTCPECREELAGLAGLPALLRRIPVGEAQQLADDDLDELAGADLPGRRPSEMLDSLLPHDPGPPGAAVARPGRRRGGGPGGRDRRGCRLERRASRRGKPAAARAVPATSPRRPRPTRSPTWPPRSGTRPRTGAPCWIRGDNVPAGDRCQLVVTDSSGHTRSWAAGRPATTRAPSGTRARRGSRWTAAQLPGHVAGQGPGQRPGALTAGAGNGMGPARCNPRDRRTHRVPGRPGRGDGVRDGPRRRNGRLAAPGRRPPAAAPARPRPSWASPLGPGPRCCSFPRSSAPRAGPPARSWPTWPAAPRASGTWKWTRPSGWTWSACWMCGAPPPCSCWGPMAGSPGGAAADEQGRCAAGAWRCPAG